MIDDGIYGVNKAFIDEFSRVAGVDIEYKDYTSVAINVDGLYSMIISKPPTKVTYLEGEKFDPAGMVVEVKYGRGAKKQKKQRRN